MLKDIIAKRYAKALLSLAGQSGETEVVKNDLMAVAEMFRTSRNLQSVVLNPAFSTKDKLNVVNALVAEMKVSAVSARFINLMVEKGRFRYIREVAASYSDLLDMTLGRVKATITSAQELSGAEVDKIKERIKAMVGKDAELTIEVDPGLIGGVKTRIGSTVYDGSIKNQVKLVRESLLKG